MPTIEEYSIHKNLLISYSAQSSQSAYEVLQIECTTTMELENDVTYELKTTDLDKIVPGSSQYAQVLGEMLGEMVDISSILDKVHAGEIFIYFIYICYGLLPFPLLELGPNVDLFT